MLKKMDISFLGDEEEAIFTNTLICKDLNEESICEIIEEAKKNPKKLFKDWNVQNFYYTCLKALEKHLRNKELDKITQSNLMFIISEIPKKWLINYKDQVEEIKSLLPETLPEEHQYLKEAIEILHKTSSRVKNSKPEIPKAIDELYERLSK